MVPFECSEAAIVLSRTGRHPVMTFGTSGYSALQSQVDENIKVQRMYSDTLLSGYTDDLPLDDRVAIERMTTNT
jgi:hypothetical protein